MQRKVKIEPPKDGFRICPGCGASGIKKFLKCQSTREWTTHLRCGKCQGHWWYLCPLTSK